jgi:outer membrane protein
MIANAIGAAMLLAAPVQVVTLEQALENARAHQPQLRQARAVTDAAEARAREAKASLLPQLSASAAYQRTTANFTARPGSVPGTPGTSRSSTFDNFNYFNDSLTLSQLLYDFGQSTGRYDAAQAQAQAQADSERAARLLTELSVRSAFFDTRANKSLVQVAREALTNQEAHLAQIEGFVQVGTRPDIDLAQARSDTANAQVQLISAENTYDISRATLNQAMGIEGPLDYEVADQALLPVYGEGQPTGPLLDEAIKARPEIASLMQQVRAQQLTVRSIEGAYGPTLAASAGATQGGISVDHLSWNLSAGLTLTWQLYQGGFTQAQVHEAEANVAQIAAQLDLVRQQLRVEVEQARLSVRAALATLGAAKDALVNARERLRLAEARYETGIGSIIELGDAQVALTTAAVQAVQADQRLSTARAQLLKALGRS